MKTDNLDGDELGVPRFNQEEIDCLVSRLMDEPQPDVAVVSAVRKLDDIEAGSGELPESFELGCQKCKEAIHDDDQQVSRFGYFYHKGCIADVL